MSDYYNELRLAVRDVKVKIDFVPRLGIVLGSGLGSLADEIETKAAISYGDISGMPVSTAQGHKGRLVFGYIGKTPVVIMQGRVHMYEGYTPRQVVMPIRLMHELGADTLLLTNAAGGINKDLTAGDLMAISDHLSFFIPSPLIGENIDELGCRFPDMSAVYDKELTALLISSGSNIKQGVYCQLRGPQYETPAEIRALSVMGCDAVGMSTVCEAIAAKHCCMRVCGISCITNMAAGISEKPLSHSEVQQTADRVSTAFKSTVIKFASTLGE